jgi:citrate/tricarballylate utilization protein
VLPGDLRTELACVGDVGNADPWWRRRFRWAGSASRPPTQASCGVIAHGQHVMTVCNACRYCEQFCPVFPALEKRRTFSPADLSYLANLCHNCGECLYACQYAPPHEFGIDVPKTLATIRSRSYESYAWPAALGLAFRRNGVRAGLGTLGFVSGMLLLVSLARPERLWSSDGSADFYGVVSHEAMVALFGLASVFALVAMGVSAVRCWRDAGAGITVTPWAMRHASRDALTLRHLHGVEPGCTTHLETRTPWRRWFHHCTFYGFALCFASTTVAAIYHSVFGWRAPYAYTSVPVFLGVVGGVGLLLGPVGLALARRRRDPELADHATNSLDTGFILLLFVTSLTGLALLVMRHTAAMGILLVVHLSAVLALFVTLPYGKFVHAIYRLIALARYHMETHAL